MNKFLSILLKLCVLNTLLASCSLNFSGIVDIPNPATRSIIPLHRHNTAAYKVTLYDKTGINIITVDTMTSYIENTYYLENETFILSSDDYTDWELANSGKRLYYSFGWNIDKIHMYPQSGLILSYHKTNGSESGGVFIHGTYDGLNTTYFKDTSYRWLSYPAEPGDTWDLVFEDSTSGSDSTHFELIDTDSKKFVTTLMPTPCYLYKEVKGEKISYHYYSPSYGLIASLDYEDGKRTRAVHIITENTFIYQ